MGQIAAVGARIGEQLVLFVERLRDFERLGGGQAEQPVGLALKGGQVVELGRGLRPAGALVFGHHALLPPHARGDLLRLIAIIAAQLLRLGVEPQPGVIAEVGADLPVIARREGADLAVARHEQRQGGGLHAADGEQHVVPERIGARGVHADDPVGLAAAARARVQPVVGRIGLQRRKALADSRVGHGGNPQPIDGLPAPRLIVDIAEDQLALAAAVGGADHAVDFGIAQELFKHRKLRTRLGDDLRLERLGQHGQRVHRPLFPIGVQLVRVAQRHQMTDGPADNILLPDDHALAAPARAQHPRDVSSHRRLLRQHQRLAHARPPLNRLYRSGRAPQSTGHGHYITACARQQHVSKTGAPDSFRPMRRLSAV